MPLFLDKQAGEVLVIWSFKQVVIYTTSQSVIVTGENSKKKRPKKSASYEIKIGLVPHCILLSLKAIEVLVLTTLV